MSEKSNISRITLPVHPWHSLTAQEVSAELHTDALTGLSEGEARQRLAQFGPNRLREERREPIWEEFLEELRQPMILLLLFTGVLYSIWGGLEDALTIFGVILTLVGVEVWNEYRAKKAIGALRKLAEPTAPVRRGGRYVEVPTEEVVPGDVILLQAGRRVPADGRLLTAYGLAADESALTGESVPVEKEGDLLLPEGAALAERRNLVFAGTTITRGRGSALLIATGIATELGRVAELAREIEEPLTPLQKAMNELSRWLVWLALGFSITVPLLAWLLTGQSLKEALLTGLSLAFATIPEEMPIIITMVLALGAYRLSQRRAIVKRLRAVETLGAVTVIVTDKTGTITENRMTVTRLAPPDLARKLLEIGVLCNSVVVNGGESGSGPQRGDPLEVALLDAAREAGLGVATLREAYPLLAEFSFDNTRKRMSALYERDGGRWVAVKGAPEAVLARCTHLWTKEDLRPLSDTDREQALAKAVCWASEGLRVLAFAEKSAPDGRLSQDDAESNLAFVGLAGLADPPRPEAGAAITACRSAGIRPIMVTGDHPLTARAVAIQVGLGEDEGMLTGPELDALSDAELWEAVGRVSLFARATPEHKLRIVRALHERGERVAVTGDGINDAPALAAADVGVAMGETGTDVAREAADIVLADDNFATIMRAVEEGRVLFANLKKGVGYYLACKVALISATLLPVLLRVPVPFAPVQIILMELFMDLAASATFVAEPAEPGLMQRPPRDPQGRFMDRAVVNGILSSAAGLFAAVSVAYLATWFSTRDLARAQTMAFVSWLLGHVFLALNLRSDRELFFRMGFFTNRLMTIWAYVTAVFVLFATLVPRVNTVLRTVPLSLADWALATCLALVGAFWIEVRKVLAWRRYRKEFSKQ